MGSLKPIAETWRTSHPAKPSDSKPDMRHTRFLVFRIIRVISSCIVFASLASRPNLASLVPEARLG